MHQALSEDIKTQGTPTPNSPAFAFVTLENQDQFFKDVVQEASNSLYQVYIADYHTRRRQSLTSQEFKDRLLANPILREVSFAFVFVFFRIEALLGSGFSKVVPSIIRQSAFAAILETNILFDLALVIDAVIHEKNREGSDFRENILFLCEKSNLNLDMKRLNKIMRMFHRDFEGTIQALAEDKFKFADGYLPSPLESDVLICYGFRNWGAHYIKSSQITYQYILWLIRRTTFVLFLAIENLYA